MKKKILMLALMAGLFLIPIVCNSFQEEWKACWNCNGRGYIITKYGDKTCSICNGTGLVRK